jgi:hypothetical protein
MGQDGFQVNESLPGTNAKPSRIRGQESKPEQKLKLRCKYIRSHNAGRSARSGASWKVNQTQLKLSAGWLDTTIADKKTSVFSDNFQIPVFHLSPWIGHFFDEILNWRKKLRGAANRREPAHFRG